PLCLRCRTDPAGDGGGPIVDVLAVPDSRRGLVAAGTVHHVAWRVPDIQAQQNWRQSLVEAGVEVTEIRDRNYFTSIYFREPGGVLLEIATDGPGFDHDEPLLELGQALKLPPWLEPRREQIAAHLPELEVKRRPPPWRTSNTSWNRPRPRTHPRWYCCTAPAPTSTTCCRWGGPWLRGRLCCPHAARSTRTD